VDAGETEEPVHGKGVMVLITLIASSPVIDWAIAHLHWPFIVAAAWQVSRWYTETRKRASEVEEHIHKMATNCFPTMQASLQNQDRVLMNMDKNIRRMAQHQTGDADVIEN